MSRLVGPVRGVLALLAQIVAMLFSLIGWIDVLEGGAAVFASGVFFVVAWLVGRVRPPKLTWISLIVALAIVLAFYIAYGILYGWGAGAATPHASDGSYTIVMTINNIYQFSSYFVAAGAVWYCIRVGGAVRESFRK